MKLRSSIVCKVMPMILGVQVMACAIEQDDDTSSAVDQLASQPSDADLDCLRTPREIIQAVFQEGVRHSPTSAVFVGDRSLDATMDDLGPAEFATVYRRMAKLDSKLAKIDPATLTAGERFAFNLATTTTHDARMRQAAKTQLWEINSRHDFGDNLILIPQAQVLRSSTDLDNLLIRYRKISVALAQRQANLQSGLAQRLTATNAVVQRAIVNYRNNGATAANGSPFADLAFDPSIDAATQDKWKAKVAKVIDSSVSPAYLRFASFLETTLLPGARTTFGYDGLGALGTTLYRELINVQTGSDLSADQIHDLGLQRVDEIETQMIAQLDTLGIHGATLSASLAELKQLPESAPATAAQVTTHSAEVLTKLYANSWSADVWGISNPPPMSVNVPAGSGAPFYVPGASTMVIPAGSSAQYELDSFVTHEYTHYLQDLVAHEPSAEPPVSPFQSGFGSIVLVEGVAHFAETVALDSTLYNYADARTAALTRLAGLSGLMLRAVRLVVDTGIHTKGFTRDQVITYMQDHLVGQPAFFASEADRYASQPAQALGYRLGVEAMFAEQARAKQALGARFSQAAFNHMALSLSGATTQLLHQATDDFIASAP